MTDTNMSELINKVHCLEFSDMCARLPDESVHMILCDLPYGVHEATWDSVIDFDVLWYQFTRIIKPRKAIVLTSVQPFTTDLIVSNRSWFKYSWVWVKSMAGDFLNAKNKPMRSHEDVLVFSGGTTANKSPNRMVYYPQGLEQKKVKHTRPYSSKFRRDSVQIVSTRPNWKTEYVSDFTNYPTTVLEFSQGNNHTTHPNEKPLNLFEYLIRTYTLEGELVFDPTCGSGTTALASVNTGRNFICSDFTPEYVDIANERLERADPYSPTKVSDTEVQLSLFSTLESSQ